MNGFLFLAFSLQVAGPAQPVRRTIAIDERLAADARLSIGDTVRLSATPDDSAGAEAIVVAVARRSTDPAEVARDEYRIYMHLDHLQSLIGYGDRVDRFALATHDDQATTRALREINDAAFGFRAHRSRDIAVGTSRTFQVVSRFHRAIGVITIVASAIFLLCILLLKVDERRRDVAALRLIGISRSTVMRSVIIEAAMVSVLGSALGAVMGWLTSALVNQHYQAVYRTPLRFALVTPGILAFAVTLSLALGVVAGYLAAQRLVRTPPLALFGR
jgi:putative ABC transport system permease protein